MPFFSPTIRQSSHAIETKTMEEQLAQMKCYAAYTHRLFFFNRQNTRNLLLASDLYDSFLYAEKYKTIKIPFPNINNKWKENRHHHE
jgi:hypothetical protein